MSSLLDNLNESERFLQLGGAVPWPFRLKEKNPKPKSTKLEALETLEQELHHGPDALPDKWELIPGAVNEDIAAELLALRRYYEDSSKQIKKLRKQRTDALLTRDDLAEFAQRGDDIRDLERQRADALVRIEELTAVAEERRKETEFLRLAHDALEAEVTLVGRDRLEVLLAQKAWDEGAPFVSPRLTGDTRGLDNALRSRAWSLALAQICEMGWHLHTWSANGDVATPLFHRPST